MAGKAYTMREMRVIVEYLVEHKAYKEIKGRKMWMDFANSQLTTRTWQSLKETFLKRILPDIHNPYYKLTMDQIRSFQQGEDVFEKEKRNRLDIRTGSEDPNTNGTENQKNEEQPTTSNNMEHNNGVEKAPGEDIICAKIASRSRSSADTLILENCDENEDQEPQKVSETPDADEKTKPLKELLTFEYTEPLTPLVRDLLEDFATESENSDKDPQSSEPDLVIDEDNQTDNQNGDKEEESHVTIQDTEEAVNNKNEENNKEMDTSEDISLQKIRESSNRSPTIKHTESNTQTKSIEKKEIKTATSEHNKDTVQQNNDDINGALYCDAIEFVTAENNAEDTEKSKNTSETNTKADKTIENSVKIFQNSGNTSADTIIPNNPEALDNSKATQKENLTTQDMSEKTEVVNKNSRKRSSSEDRESKKQKVEPPKEAPVNDIIEINTDTPVDDTEARYDAFIQKSNKNSSAQIEARFDALMQQSDNTSDASKSNDKNSTHIPSKEVAKSADIEKADDIEQNSFSKPASKDDDNIEQNPCLQSVSLFAEQFNTTKYTDSESDEPTSATNVHENAEKTVQKEKKTIQTEKEIPQKNKETLQKDKGTVQKNKEILQKNKETLQKNKETLQKNKETLQKNKETLQKNKETLQKDTNMSDKKNSNNTKEIMVEEILNQKDVVVLPSHSESDNQETSQAKNKPINKVSKLQLDRALASVFGFSNGGATTSRKRRISHRRSHRHYNNSVSDSSEWTSESESQGYVSPPRGRKNRQTRKYLKPKSARILSLEEEGGLFVMYGKKIYPLVKDGKIIKNYLTHLSDSGSESEDESYWRQKYVEEKKRAAELKKLLEEAKGDKTTEAHKPSSPILRSNTSRNVSNNKAQQQKSNPNPYAKQQSSLHNPNDKERSEPQQCTNKAETAEQVKKIKITFAKNNKEMRVEGHWSQIHPVLEEFAQIFNQEACGDEPVNKKPISDQLKTVEIESGKTTPIIPVVDSDVHEKINKIEGEIFKQIEEMDKSDGVIKEDNTNITKRKPGRPRRASSTSTTSSRSSAKTPKKSKISEEIVTNPENKQSIIKVQDESNQKDTIKTNKRESKQIDVVQPELKHKVATKAASRRSSKRQLDVQQKANVTIGVQQKDNVTSDVQQKDNLSTTATPNQQESKQQIHAQENVSKQVETKVRESKRIYKQNESKQPDNDAVEMSSKSAAIETRPRRQAASPRKLDNYATDSSSDRVRTRRSQSKDTSKDDEEIRYMLPPTPQSNKKPRQTKNRSLAQLKVILQKDSRNSLDSMQGYQDSDASFQLIKLPKRKRKLSLSIQRKNQNRRIIRRNSYPTLLQELSSDSSNSSYFKPLRKSHSTINSEPYVMESYRLPLPQNKHPLKKMEPIIETSPIAHEFDADVRDFNSVFKDTDRSSNDNSNIIVEVGSSSNVSLPLSPEISVVENLSINREMVKGIHPTINEMQSNETTNKMDYSKYLISDVDVSIPLMEQVCGLQKSIDNVRPTDKAQSNIVSESLLSKISTVNIADTISESLDQRLRDMLLESAKKMKKDHIENAMEVDETIKAKKTKSRKRCSTPRKRKTVSKAKAPNIDPVIEEHTENCSYSGRKSCPPVITFLVPDENANHCPDHELNTEKPQAKRGRKKKDVLKVKIQRPITRSLGKIKDKSMENDSTISVTDSSINDTICGAFLNEGSIELIHNHSETCLLASECIENSVEFIEISKSSVISLNSTQQSVDSEFQRMLDNAEDMTEEFCNTGDTMGSGVKTSSENFESAIETAYHTPVADSSIITEDLSDEGPTQPTKWYLLSEEENTNSTIPEQKAKKFGANLNQLRPATCAAPNLCNIPDLRAKSFGANLKQLFPIACAVPDLSTISEMSKENEDSRKANLEAEGDSQSLF